jgi:hypothetical protein
VIAVASQPAVDELVLQLKGLVYARALLEDRGAPAQAIRVHEVEIDRVRGRLAELVRRVAA